MARKAPPSQGFSPPQGPPRSLTIKQQQGVEMATAVNGDQEEDADLLEEIAQLKERIRQLEATPQPPAASELGSASQNV